METVSRDLPGWDIVTNEGGNDTDDYTLVVAYINEVRAESGERKLFFLDNSPRNDPQNSPRKMLESNA